MLSINNYIHLLYGAKEMTFNSVNKNWASRVGNTAEQQSFLGTTIESFNVTAGFGDSPSQCTVNLATDKDFGSDGKGLGLGVDVYHTGNGDRFRPPPIGTPVFFSYGRKRANVGDAFVRTIDDYYGTNYKPTWNGGMPIFDKTGKVTAGNPGYWHFAFGGILQSYTQNESNTGGLRHTVTITDPREILANCTLILNNYAGTTFNNSNLINIYGFLEHNAIDATLRIQNDPDLPTGNKDILNAAGGGMDIYTTAGYQGLRTAARTAYPKALKAAYYLHTLANFGGGNSHPMTGTGMSRRSSSGMPYYRLIQAYNYLMGFSDSGIHSEYAAAGYGGFLKFRGLQYAIDLSALPILPKAYMLDYDAISILDLCQEICEAANHELFFTLLPRFVGTGTGWASSSCAGVIKAVTINKSVASAPGQIRTYLNRVSKQVDATKVDIGYELTNETTDKVVTGGKETSVYYFPTPYGGPQHGMHTYQTNDAIVPYYGLLSPGVPTIPRGYGSYSQICLDAGSCQADGVGRYYIATEIELRAASVSFEKWTEFLLMYNNLYMESIESNDIQDLYYAQNVPAGENGQTFFISNNYQITVPRCTWPNHSKEIGFYEGEPKNPCHPPYGWPLYWHRARNIGIPHAGAAGVSAMAAQVIDRADAELGNFVNEEMKSGSTNPTGAGETTEGEEAERSKLGGGNARSGNGKYDDTGYIAVNNARNATVTMAQSDKLSRRGLANAKIVYNFLKKIADECLGKKFLVQVPQRPNTEYTGADGKVGLMDFTAYPSNNYIGAGPYGFPAIKPGGGTFTINGVAYSYPASSMGGSVYQKYLRDPFVPPMSQQGGGLAVNYSAPVGRYTFNYTPSKEGGYYGYYGTPNLSTRQSMALEPIDNAFIKGDDGRLQCYVRFSNSQHISFADFPKGSFSQQFIDPSNGKFIPDISYAMENSNNSNDQLSQTVPQFTTTVTVGGKDFVPQTAVSYVKADLDDNFYIAPNSKLQPTAVWGNAHSFKNVFQAPHKIFNTETCKEEETYTVGFRQYYPKATSGGPISIATIDLDLCYSGAAKGWSRDGVYALITLPDRAVQTISTTFRDGMNMQVNAGSIKHYLQLDVVRGMPGFSNQVPLKPQNSILNCVHDLPNRENDPLGVGFIAGADQAARKAYQGLTFDLTNRINIVSPSPIVPDLVALPLRSEERSYGPWTSFYNAYDNIGGKMEYIHDESLTPWNYGGYGLMDKAGRSKVEMGTSAQVMSERGAFSLPMEPSGITLGTTLTGSGPLVSDINIKVDAQGIESTFNLSSYTTSFGKMQKQRADNLKKLTRERQKLLDVENNLIRRNMGKSQRGFNYSAAINNLRSQLSNPDFSTRNYSALERSTGQSNDNLNLSVDPRPSQGGYVPYGIKGGIPESTHKGPIEKSSSLQSQEGTNYMHSLLSVNPVQAAKTYLNSASSKLSDQFTAAAYGYHSSMTAAPPITPPADSTQYNDTVSDEDISSLEVEN